MATFAQWQPRTKTLKAKWHIRASLILLCTAGTIAWISSTFRVKMAASQRKFKGVNVLNKNVSRLDWTLRSWIAFVMLSCTVSSHTATLSMYEYSKEWRLFLTKNWANSKIGKTSYDPHLDPFWQFYAETSKNNQKMIIFSYYVSALDVPPPINLVNVQRDMCKFNKTWHILESTWQSSC